MNRQDILNTVYKHLKAQRKQALDSSGNCSYLTDYGLKCAIGCLIPDDLYCEWIEGKSVATLFDQGFMTTIFPDIDISDIPFLSDIQNIHDIFFYDLEKKFQELCSKYALELKL